MKKWLFILLLGGVTPQLAQSPKVSSVQLFCMDFNMMTRYGYFEKDVIKSSKKNAVIISGKMAEDFYLKISKYLSYDSLLVYETRNVDYGSLDLRLVCLISYEGMRKTDTLGFNKLEYMVINQKIYRKNDRLLRSIVEFAPKRYRKTIE